MPLEGHAGAWTARCDLCHTTIATYTSIAGEQVTRDGAIAEVNAWGHALNDGALLVCQACTTEYMTTLDVDQRADLNAHLGSAIARLTFWTQTKIRAANKAASSRPDGDAGLARARASVGEADEERPPSAVEVALRVRLNELEERLRLQVEATQASDERQARERAELRSEVERLRGAA